MLDGIQGEIRGILQIKPMHHRRFVKPQVFMEIPGALAVSSGSSFRQLQNFALAGSQAI